jgi:tRNA G18 (ribose-2'-O)-methylase SpoU
MTGLLLPNESRSSGKSSLEMPLRRLSSIDAPELEPYRNLRTTNLTRLSGLFIAESKPLVKRLVDSDLQADSFLIDEKYLDEAVAWLPTDCDLFVLPGSQVSELIGFDFPRGYLACGIRPSVRIPTPSAWCRESSWMGVMLVGLQDPENMGSIFRTCAALGISDVLIGPECVDPFARRVLRVSMGNAFKLRLYEVNDPLANIEALQSANIEVIATSLADPSQDLSGFRVEGPSVVIFGNEAHGLPAPIQDVVNRRVRIDMELGTDSLNVSVAAGIILHNLCRGCYRNS